MAGSLDNQYNIYDTGCDRQLLRGSAQSEVEIPYAQDQSLLSGDLSISGGSSVTATQDFNGGLFNPVAEVTQPQSILSGDVVQNVSQPAGVLFNTKTSFTDTTAGYRLGIDTTDSLLKFRIGNVTNELFWNGTTLAITGTITATSGVIGGFTIGATTLTATNLTLTSGAANVANIAVGTGSNLAGMNSANAAGDITFWAGDTFANRASAPFRVTAAGAVTATSVTTLNVNTTFQLAASTVNATAAQLNTLVGGVASDASSLHIHAVNSGTATRATGAGTGTQTVAHGLGVAPRLIIIDAGRTVTAASSMGWSHGSSQGAAGNNCVRWQASDTAGTFGTTTSGSILSLITGSGNSEAAVSAVDATNFTLNFTTHANTGGPCEMHWIAYA